MLMCTDEDSISTLLGLALRKVVPNDVLSVIYSHSVIAA